MKKLLVLFCIMLISFSVSAKDNFKKGDRNEIKTKATDVNSKTTLSKSPEQLKTAYIKNPVYQPLVADSKTSKGAVSINATASNDPTSAKLIDTSGKFRIGLSLVGGTGFQNVDVGVTNMGDKVTMSLGGGGGAMLSLGYCVSSAFNIDAEIGAQTATLSLDVSNASGNFSRTVLLGTLRYKIPVSSKSSVNLGAGAGYYMGGKLDLDLSKVTGDHAIIKYKSTPGIHVLVEFERTIQKWSRSNARWAWSVGIKYYNITYKANSSTDNGYSIPVSYLPHDLINMDGSGIDGVFSLIVYL